MKRTWETMYLSNYMIILEKEDPTSVCHLMLIPE
jgi:hypothetical protein